MSADLEFARRLIDMGVPVFVSRRAATWPKGGTSRDGYIQPEDWQGTTPGDLSVLEQWKPGDALCAVGGHLFDYVDDDPRSGGAETMTALHGAGAMPPFYARVATPSGGTHWYVSTTGLGSLVGSPDNGHPGVDLRAGRDDGTGRGFVYLPGTERASKVDGVVRPYVLLEDLLEEWDGPDQEAQELRAWFEARHADAHEERARNQGDAFRRTVLGTPVPACHDNAGRDYAASLAARGYDWEEARHLLWARVSDFQNVDPRDPFTEADLKRWWKGAYRKFAPSLEWDPQASPFVDWEALWADDTVDEYLLEPILPLRRQMALYSEAKVGKSLFLLELAVHLAQGRDYLDFKCPEQRSVLYVDHENDLRGDVRRRLINMGYEPQGLGNLHYLSMPNMAKLDTAAGAAHLIAYARLCHADVVVLDTVSRTIHGAENENDTWLAFYAHTGAALRREEVALVRLDHTGKDLAKGQRGGSAKTGDVDAVWHLSKGDQRDRLTLECKYVRFHLEEEVQHIDLIRLDGPLRHEVRRVGDMEVGETAATYVERLDKLRVPNGASIRECIRRLKEAGQPAEQRAVTTAQSVRMRRVVDRFDDGCSEENP